MVYGAESDDDADEQSHASHVYAYFPEEINDGVDNQCGYSSDEYTCHDARHVELVEQIEAGCIRKEREHIDDAAVAAIPEFSYIQVVGAAIEKDAGQWYQDGETEYHSQNNCFIGDRKYGQI